MANLTSFKAGDIVVSVSGDGAGDGTYTDNQAAPITLEEIDPLTGNIDGTLVLPETTTVRNGVTEYAISGEYGSSSEGSLSLSADGQSLVIAGYGVNPQTFNSGGAAVYGNAAEAQSTSIVGGRYTAVPRVIADIRANGVVDTSTELYDVFNTNNPRSVATVDGTSFYIGGQGVKGDTTQGVFFARDGANAATAIDTSTDVRTVLLHEGRLYVSRDSTQGTGGTSNISQYGATAPTTATTPTPLPDIDGSVTLTAAQENSVNASAVGTTVHLSPENYFFANDTTLYIADGGNPKEGGLGDGGLQKWVFDGSTWNLLYTLSQGLSLVADTATSGSTGLIGLTGVVNGGTVTLYATNSTIGDLDQTSLYTISDSLAATSAATGEAFTTLVTAAPDTNIRGVALAPQAATTTTSNTTVASGTTSTGLTVTSGSSVTVLSGGTLSASTIEAGGIATISAGGLDSATTLAQGATETVYGSASGDQIEGTQTTSSGGTAKLTGETVYNGGTVTLLNGNTATGTILANGGALDIVGNAAASNTTISSGGVVALQSPKATLAGSLLFAGPGTLSVTSLTTTSAGFGDQAVISGFGTGDIIDVTVIGTGASLATSTSGGNTVASITSGTASETFVFSGAVASSLSLVSDGNGGEEIAYAAPPVPSSGNLVVSSGQTSNGLTVSNGATLTVNSGGTVGNTTILAGGTAIVSGTDSAATISAGGNETLLGTATGDLVAGTQLVSGTGSLLGAVSNETVANGGVVDLFLKGTSATGLIVQSGGALNISGNATASNTVLSGGILNLQSSKSVVAGSLTFSGGGVLEESTLISAGFGVGATISGFGSGDSVDLTQIGNGATLGSATSGGNTVLTVTSGSIATSATFAGTYAPGFFSLTQDAGSGVMITATGTPCYGRGTLIGTDRGETAVEDLRIGDVLVTASGAHRPLRWIGTRSYAGRFATGRDILPVVIRADAFAPGIPRRDLTVSPLHAMFLDGCLIPAAALVNDVSIVQCREVERIDYFHLELDTHDVILAEGAPSETFVDDDSRAMFHNAAQYASLYPDTVRTRARYCAPRLEEGEALETIRLRLLARATGTDAATATAMPLDGFLDIVTHDRITGWAFEPDAPIGTRVRIRLVANGATLAELDADHPREDLLAAGIGDGCHAFDHRVPGGLSPFLHHRIELSRVSDGAALPCGARSIAARPYVIRVPEPGAPSCRGSLDLVTRNRIAGWAAGATGAEPIAVQILDNGIPVARALANGFRADLREAGIGVGRHAFEVSLPAGLSPLVRHVIEVRAEADGSPLDGSPHVIEAADAFDADLEATIGRAVAAIDRPDEQARLLSFMLGKVEQLRAVAASGKSETRLRETRADRRLGAIGTGRRRALVLDETMPLAGRDAGSQAILSHMQALQRLGFDVSIAATTRNPSDAAARAALEAAGFEVCAAPFYASTEEVLARAGDTVDLVYLHRVAVASAYLALARRHLPRARILYAVADLHHLRFARQAAIEDRPELARAAERLRFDELACAWNADAVLTHSHHEAELLRAELPHARVHVTPWEFPIRSRMVPFSGRDGIAFVGNYDHAPNRDAAIWLATEILPRLRSIAPGIRCLLVGARMPSDIRALASDAVEILGEVEDLAAVLDRVRLTVAPLRFGAGVKGKVLESLAAGTPCAMTSLAAEGIDPSGGLARWVADDADGLARLIHDLHESEPAHHHAAATGLALIRETATAERVDRALEAAVGGEALGAQRLG